MEDQRSPQERKVITGLARKAWDNLRVAFEQVEQRTDDIIPVEVTLNGTDHINLRNRYTKERLLLTFDEYKLSVEVETAAGSYSYSIESDDCETVYFLRDKTKLRGVPEAFHLREGLLRNINQIVTETFTALDPKASKYLDAA